MDTIEELVLHPSQERCRRAEISHQLDCKDGGMGRWGEKTDGLLLLSSTTYKYF
ncbi:hypothetical protein [Planktothrix sp. FACHB-1355]|uniref:hypothetical protein n=1 Tax=Planktothrix sp. FACHB-1355 TaxID=2692854 RepID=UPI00168AD1CD|nr:hypothetical protein [Planktothrix sp. FACHB-1355]